MRTPRPSFRFLAAGLAVCLFTAAATAADVKILLPLGRTAYQTNEWIDVSVVRSGPTELPASELRLTLTGNHGGKVGGTFPASAVPLRGKESRSVEHLHVNGFLLRPGKYTVEAAVGGATARTDIEVHSHVRQSSFRLVNWGRAAKPAEQLVQGEDSLGFNLFYGNPGDYDPVHFLRGGVDWMSNCTMSGGHQMDLRQECDWSDPYVLRGGTQRVVRRAMADRTRPHVGGVHFYDEPGLTWRKDPATGQDTPHGIPSQVRSYVAAFDRPPPDYLGLDPKNPEHVAPWRQWAIWKLGFMDAAWRDAQFGVGRVRPDLLSITQSQYGWTAFTDGYYFNVTRGLPVASGHGGYHDFGPGYFNPSFFLEMARARDFAKPCWYLPCWYGNTTPDQFRAEQYLSFQTNIQGMMSPPDLDPAINATGRQGIVESNQLMKKLGPIFTTMAVTKPPVAMLYSLSQAIHTQTQDRKLNYAHEIPQGRNMPLTYLAGKLLQQQFLGVLDEDVLDGTLANDHKAVVLTSLDYLAPAVVRSLEEFAGRGGLVLLTGDCTVQIKGATKLPVSPKMPDQEAIDKLMAAKKYNELGPYQMTAKFFEGARPLARAIKDELDRAGIKPPLESDAPTVAVTRQAAGDVEYLFAVNVTPDQDDKQDPKNSLKALAATLTLADDGRPVYDAVRGGAVREFKAVREFTPADGKLSGVIRFGPGEMRVFARTARPVGCVHAASPVLRRDMTREQAPIEIEIGASVVDAKGGKLSCSVPLHIRVIDPLGVTRYELYRATELGDFAARLPLAANDPAGAWKVVVAELLNNTEDVVSFTYTPPARATSAVGATPRAVYAANDRGNAFRFARLFHEVTVVKGTSAFNDAAARRLAKILEPWGVRCKEMPLAEAARSRRISEEEATTWCGISYAGRGQIKPGDGNPPTLAGFAVQGPVILLGNPEDNAIIQFLAAEHFLPYAPDPANFPGPGRGMIAWQRDGVGRGQESITLIAYDVAGMSEAVGSFFEAVAGIDPLTKWTLPQTDSLTPATTAPGLVHAATVAWSVLLPDRVLGLKAAGAGLNALSHDGSLTTISAEGKASASKALGHGQLAQAQKDMAPAADSAAAAALAKQARPDRMAKLSVSSGGKVAVAYWGGTLRVVDGDRVVSEQNLPQDVTALAWLGDKVVAGLADGRVLALTVK
jgi:hypothetical protein